MPLKENFKLETKFKRPELFRDDLERIEEILLKKLKPRSFSLKFDKFEVDKVDDLPKKGSSSGFYLYSHEPYLYIHMSKYGASISTENSELATIGALTEISSIISKRQRKFLSLSSYCFYALVPVAPFLFLGGLKKLNLNKNWELAFLILYLALFILGSYSFFRPSFSKINFFSSEERSNIFSRNKDQIIIGLIIAVIATLVGSYVTYLFTKGI